MPVYNFSRRALFDVVCRDRFCALTVQTDKTTKTISPGIYGQFREPIFNSVHGGIWGNQILNGTLELRPAMPRRGARSGAGAVGSQG
jgi:hypothetical protein